MIKRKYIKRLYIEEAYCDKCGAPMEFSGVGLLSSPAQYPFVCSNKECDEKQTFYKDNLPGELQYEFE